MKTRTSDSQTPPNTSINTVQTSNMTTPVQGATGNSQTSAQITPSVRALDDEQDLPPAKKPKHTPRDKGTLGTKRKFTAKHLQPNIARMGTAVISLANQLNDTNSLSPANIKQMQSDIESIKHDIIDMAIVAKFKDTTTLTSLVASIRKDEYLTKKNNKNYKVKGADVYELIKSLQTTSSPQFRLINKTELSDDKKQIIVANAFDIVGEVPEHDVIFTKGIVAIVKKNPAKVLKARQADVKEPKRSGTQKKGLASVRENTNNIWISNLIEDNHVNYACSLNILAEKQATSGLKRKDNFTHVIWMPRDAMDEWTTKHGVSGTNAQLDSDEDTDSDTDSDSKTY